MHIATANALLAEYGFDVVGLTHLPEEGEPIENDGTLARRFVHASGAEAYVRYEPSSLFAAGSVWVDGIEGRVTMNAATPRELIDAIEKATGMG